MQNAKSGLIWTRKLSTNSSVKFALSLVFLAVVEIAQVPWILIQNSLVGIQFVDTKYLLDHSLCVADGVSALYSVSSECSPVPYIYGLLPVTAIHAFHISSMSATVLAHMQGLVAVLGLSYFASTLRTKYFIFFILALLSPPISLLFERGNLDLILIPGLFLLSYFFKTGKRYSSLILTTILALLKFYPVCLFAYLLFGPRKITVTRIEATLYGLAFIAVLWNFSLINRSSLPASWEQSYGVGVLGALSKMSGLNIPISMILIALVVALTLCFAVGSRTSTCRTSLRSEFYIFGLVFILTYVAGFNYDYRLFAVVISSFCVLERIEIPRSLRRSILIALMTSLYLSNPAGLNVSHTNITLIISGISEMTNLYLAFACTYIAGCNAAIRKTKFRNRI